MITIPEYVYEDDAIKFVCPALDLLRDKAARMHAVLTNPKWPDVLNEMKYICYTFRALGFDSKIVNEALIKRYNRICLEGCLKEELPGYENREKRNCVAKRIRKAWCCHMRDCLEEALTVITIPEYVYEDDAIKFVCPALELAREDAARMRAVLTDPNWPDVLNKMKYICYAFRTLGFDSDVVWYALIKRYDCGALEGCLVETLLGNENREERIRVAKRIRQSWSDHMRAQLKYINAQG